MSKQARRAGGERERERDGEIEREICNIQGEEINNVLYMYQDSFCPSSFI